MLSKAARALHVEKYATVVIECTRWCLKVFVTCSCMTAHEAHDDTQRTDIGPVTSIEKKKQKRNEKRKRAKAARRALLALTSATLTHNGKNVKKGADRALLALMASIKDVYFRQVSHFLEEGNKHHERRGQLPPTLVVRDNVWDLQCALLRKFLELAKKHGASASDPRVLFGYHGTSTGNAEKIMCQGFSPRCRHSGFSGAFFSGMLEHSAGFARERGRCPGDILLVILLLDGQQMCGRHMYEHQHLRGHPARPHLVNAAECVFDEKYAMHIARLRGF
jgi:hypothetical protein